MTTITEIDFLDRIVVQEFLAKSWEYLMREKAYFSQVLEKIPGDVTAMGAMKRIDNDISIIEPLVKTAQKANLREIEKMTGKRFSYLLESKNKSIDVLKKV